MLRSGSVGSDRSWTSGMSGEHIDDRSRECMEFMRDFVERMFGSSSSAITPLDKAQFGHFCQQSAGRLWFARFVNAQRVNNQRVLEQTFYGLVQYFAVALFECYEEEDFGPAKTLMNMCFTFYFEAVQPTGGAPHKHFLYSYLKEQPIWQSLRFWNAAFFDAVQQERARKPTPTRDQANGQDEREFQENVTFGQLGTFTCNMRAFGLSQELCMEFLRKQSTIVNLKDEQVQMLRKNIMR
ncbi:hypothetical protein CAPTEDRAFT_148510 [Capitella teleta]|uniref:SBF1/SBF2 domain-containing protein n=1 Tax=Capitella teleta TaxID=283909 RepID=R7TYG9_CAPTE|nr:hypothetical protein CAPTEDRAFT_148510 [Capitella teleta]|eukprot:ELT98672.1 hypothetical protein CAPTEDRAFT_148510 [Capitella teleta]